MKAIIQSIRPEWVAKILSGKKTIEVRKRYIEPPFKAYIYCTGGAGKKYNELVSRWNGARFISRKVDKDWLPSGNTTQYLLDYNRTHPLHKDTYELNGKVVAEYVCDRVDKWEYVVTPIGECRIMRYYDAERKEQDKACLDIRQLLDYGNGKDLYAYHISDLKTYDKPKELREFMKPCRNDCELADDCINDKNNSFDVCREIQTITRHPQDFMYVEEL